MTLTGAQRLSLQALDGAWRVAERRGDTGYYLAFIHGPERVCARNLAAKGLIDWNEKTLLGRITPAGREALK